MKIKGDFVTNSSSTSFIFIFEGGDIKTLFSKIIKYKKHFDLKDNGYYDFCEDITKVNAADVVDSIQDVFLTNDYLNIIDLSNLEEEVIEDLSESLDSIETEKKRGNEPYSFDYYTVNRCNIILDKIKKAKEYGLDSVFRVDFGDNHGDISGGRIGCTMDYLGRRISIDKNDLIVFTEQNR